MREEGEEREKGASVTKPTMATNFDILQKKKACWITALPITYLYFTMVTVRHWIPVQNLLSVARVSGCGRSKRQQNCQLVSSPDPTREERVW